LIWQIESWGDIINQDNLGTTTSIMNPLKLEQYLNEKWYKWLWAFQQMRDNLLKDEKMK